MIELVPFEPDHLDLIELQPEQKGWLHDIGPEERMTLKEKSDAWTFLCDGKPMICSGILFQREGLALAWSYFSHDAGRHLVAITRHARRIMARQPYPRIEAHVVRGFDQGARWLALLGFECETPNGMKCFTPSGLTVDLWARVREPVMRPRMALVRGSAARLLLAEV